MALSDAQFTAWMASASSIRTVLVEVVARIVSTETTQERGQHSSVQFFWFWWYQCINRHAPLCGLTLGECRICLIASIHCGYPIRL